MIFRIICHQNAVSRRFCLSVPSLYNYGLFVSSEYNVKQRNIHVLTVQIFQYHNKYSVFTFASDATNAGCVSLSLCTKVSSSGFCLSEYPVVTKSSDKLFLLASIVCAWCIFFTAPKHKSNVLIFLLLGDQIQDESSLKR